ncbi:uncharacterized protein LOC121773453 isoform X2 [Salvia splendens]|uniref:uncharacterized protein LOC121773453 isoform X2 n=1 Tax=Salvia splendens TaxID=180675 RepID=UPI001C25D35D|nr:uncharacterized protein LOC121773453 isoform X2 [Salvia splendens]
MMTWRGLGAGNGDEVNDALNTAACPSSLSLRRIQRRLLPTAGSPSPASKCLPRRLLSPTHSFPNSKLKSLNIPSLFSSSHIVFKLDAPPSAWGHRASPVSHCRRSPLISLQHHPRYAPVQPPLSGCLRSFPEQQLGHSEALVARGERLELEKYFHRLYSKDLNGDCFLVAALATYWDLVKILIRVCNC